GPAAAGDVRLAGQGARGVAGGGQPRGLDHRGGGVIPARIARLRQDRRPPRRGQPRGGPPPGEAPPAPHGYPLRPPPPPAGPGAGVRSGSPSSSATGRSGPRRQEATTPSVSVSAAKTRTQILPQACRAPQPGMADRTSAVNASSPRTASLPGCPPHRLVTT